MDVGKDKHGERVKEGRGEDVARLIHYIRSTEWVER